jgi:hypothetical protein
MSNNDGLTAFLELSEHGKPREGSPPSPRRAVIDLMTYADARGSLQTEGAWRLNPAEARRMEDTLGYAPPGGWPALVALICGTGALAATHHGFYPKQSIASWQARDDREVRLELAEAFTRFLVPPLPAAGLFTVLSMHPYWGLRVAKEQGRAGDNRVDPEVAEQLFPERAMEIAAVATFGAIAGFMSGLTVLDTKQAYPLDALVAYAACCFATSWSMAADLWDGQPLALPLFLGDEPRHNNMGAVESTVADIVECVLVPAGLVRRFDDCRFTVHPDVEGVRVGDYTQHEKEGWFGFVTATEPRFLVA